MSLTQVFDYIDKLKSLLSQSGKVVAVSQEFKEINENSQRVRFVLKLLEEHDLIVKGKLKLEKNNAIAESCRMKGNQFYENKQFLDALSSYNQSLCFAESDCKSIPLAYANRSAVYSELKLYEKCLKNVELAKANQYPSPEKLKQREETSLFMINNKSKLSFSNVPIGANYLKLSYPTNKKIPFLADCLELKSDKDFGRYIVTKSALRPGDVVCCEEPFTRFLLPSHRFKYCATCLNDNFLDLAVACSGCTSTMFCSEECAKLGQEKFHKFECPIIDKLNSMCTKILRIALRSFFEALYVCDGNLKELKALIEENQDSSITVFDYEFPFDSKTVFKAIDALASNESGRTQADLFQRAGVVAIVSDMFLKHTKLREILQTKDDEDFFYSFFFKQSQIAACNYHGLYNGVVNKSEIESNPQYGTGSFPFCSLLNHSCAPNLVRVTSECKNYVVINRPIPAGGQLFDNYGFHHCLEEFQERQTSLKNQYMFQCTCEACTGKFPLYPELKYCDLRFGQFISDDVEKLAQLSFERAKKKFQPYCDYLKRMDSKYPNYEISSVQECLLRCFTIFTMSEFKMKLCEH